MGISEIARKRRWESESVRPLISVAFRSPFLNLKNTPCPRLTCVKNIYVQGDHGAPPGGGRRRRRRSCFELCVFDSPLTPTLRHFDVNMQPHWISMATDCQDEALEEN